ncbi:hypothetical protein D1007_25072 [Hordeum vulgare]|nr:hypothetical protein D1007_25072 [Hordeum vulgare]
MSGRCSARFTSSPPAPHNACPRGLSPRGLSVAPSSGLPWSASDPVSSPRILLRGECSTAAFAGPSEALSPLLLDGHMRVWRLGATPSAPAKTELQPSPRIKSIIVAPSPGESVAISGKDPGWIEISHRGGRRAFVEPPVPSKLPGVHRPDHRQAFNAGHISSRCPQNPRLQGRGGSARNRLGPAPPSQSLHTRLRFPPPPPSAMSSHAPAMLHHLDSTRRLRESRSVTVPSPTVDHAVFFLRSHAVTLSAADGVNATSPMAVGRALEAQISVPLHSLRVTAHHPSTTSSSSRSQRTKSVQCVAAPFELTTPASTSRLGTSTTTPPSTRFCYTSALS